MGNFIPQNIGEFVIAVILLTVGAMGKQIIDGIIALATGKQAEERTLLGQYRTDAEQYRKERDRAETDSRRAREHASELRWMLLQMGVPSAQLPVWPSREDNTDYTSIPTPTSIIEPPQQQAPPQKRFDFPWQQQ